MAGSQASVVSATEPGTAPSRVGETIAEVAFALLVVGVWLVTCLAG